MTIKQAIGAFILFWVAIAVMTAGNKSGQGEEFDAYCWLAVPPIFSALLVLALYLIL